MTPERPSPRLLAAYLALITLTVALCLLYRHLEATTP